MSDEQNVEGQEPVETSPEPTAETEVGASDDATGTDERGVPLTNVVAEMKRKLEAAERKLQEVEMRSIPPAAQPVQEEPVAPVRKKTRDEVIAEINADPEAWISNKFREYEASKAEVERKHKLAEADRMLYEKDPKNYRTNVQKVLNIINEYGISTADPVKGVKAAINILEKDTKLSMSAKERVEEQKKATETVRTEQIKKTTTPPVSKPKITSTPAIHEDLYKRIQARGKEDDVAAYLRATMFNDDKK